MNEKVLATANAVMDEALANWKSGGVVVFKISESSTGQVCAYVDKDEMPHLIAALDDAKRYAPTAALPTVKHLAEKCAEATDEHWPAFPDPETLARLMQWVHPAGWEFKFETPPGFFS